MKCVAFNRRGTLLAAGCADGRCIIWNFGKLVIAKELHDEQCASMITSISWSKYGYQILVSAIDKSLTIWDVSSGEKINRIILPETPMQAHLHPRSSAPSICLVCPVSMSSAPAIVDLNTGSRTFLPVTVLDKGKQVLTSAHKKITGVSAIAACFNKYGDLVYVGNSNGEILIIDYKSNQVQAMVPVSGGVIIRNIVFSRNGQYLLTNSYDRTIRIYENLLPLKDELGTVEELKKTIDVPHGIEKMKLVGSKCLRLLKEFQEPAKQLHFKAACFSNDGELVISGSASKEDHDIYIWNQLGDIVRILDGPKEGLIDWAWHPVCSVIVSVSWGGVVYVWSPEYAEKWSAFAPDFEGLEENVEYVERKDEFDLNPRDEEVKESDVTAEDDEVDILTMEKDDFSDSDMSQEELCYLPITPSPDKCAGTSSKLIDNNHSGSPCSVEAGQNNHGMNHASSPLAVVDAFLEEGAVAAPLKRKRSPSEKGWEMRSSHSKTP
ncbi:protein RBL-like [Tripterygium wilfordii]|uniref:protein RBL-like n=1 Tax=Tripterygium wilfordii TaxID=458696 RepID=UPI0018F808A3|nr:protein RBL-like [Tripterygium wilfordii]